MVLSLSLFLGLKVNGARNQAVYPGQRHQGNSKPGYFFYDGEGALLFFFPLVKELKAGFPDDRAQQEVL